MFFVYILFSKKLNRYYIGTTDNVEKRLFEHNSGLYVNSFTMRGIPWELSLSYTCESSEKAYKLEAVYQENEVKEIHRTTDRRQDNYKRYCNETMISCGFNSDASEPPLVQKPLTFQLEAFYLLDLIVKKFVFK